MDGKFHGYSSEQIENYTSQIINKVHEKLQKDIPVFILYASPEAESWFIADWENGFEYLYCYSGVVADVEHGARLFFSHNLKQYIDRNILGEYSNNIEEYGWFGENYLKLSDQIIDTIQMGIKDYINEMRNVNPAYVRQIVESRDLYYSKKLHGDRMLRCIKPNLVASKCRKYFGTTYNQMASAEL